MNHFLAILPKNDYDDQHLLTLSRNTMKKLIKWTIWIVVSIILIIIIATVLLSFLIKPNDIKPIISKQIFKATGQQVVFKGDIHWRLFPTLSIKLDNAFINNPPSFGEGVLANISELSVGVKLLPLLHDSIETTDLVLNDATINLIKNKNGQTNWQAQQAATIPSQTIANPTTTNPPKGKSLTFQVPSLKIKNMTINWQNKQDGQTTTIKNLNLTASNIQQGKAFPAQLNFRIDNNKPDIHGTISLASNITLKPNNQYVLQNLNLKTNLTGNGLPEGRLNSTLQGAALITSKSISLNPINMSVNKSQISGNINVSNFATMATQFNLNATPFNMKNLSGNATLQGSITAANARTAPSLKTLNGKVTIKIKNGTYQGVNIPYLINVAKILKKGKLPPKMQGANQTTFGNLSASAVINKGVAYTNDLYISSPVINVKGNGSLNLVAQTINYNLKISSADSNDVNLQNIPLVVSGPLKSPKASLDKNALLKGVFKQQVQKQLDNAVKQLQLKLFQ